MNSELFYSSISEEWETPQELFDALRTRIWQCSYNLVARTLCAELASRTIAIIVGLIG